MKRGMIVVGIGALALVVAFAGWTLRPGASGPSSVHPAAAIECTAATGAGADECAAWGDAILAEDAAPRTFRREDVRRLRLDRDLFGLGASCRAEYFLSRYPDRPVWSQEVPCR
jgi:hypothetical protein